MESRWIGVDGYEVVPALRDGRQVLRVLRNGWVVADCSSVDEVARHVDLADLCEVFEFPARTALARPAEARTSSHHR